MSRQRNGQDGFRRGLSTAHEISAEDNTLSRTALRNALKQPGRRRGDRLLIDRINAINVADHAPVDRQSLPHIHMP